MSDGRMVSELTFSEKGEEALEKNLLQVMEKMNELGI
jgi:hypothetical protein